MLTERSLLLGCRLRYTLKAGEFGDLQLLQRAAALIPGMGAFKALFLRRFRPRNRSGFRRLRSRSSAI